MFATFSRFAAVSLCRVADLAETFPLFPVSGPFLPDTPGFQVPPDSVLPSLPVSGPFLPDAPGFHVPPDSVLPSLPVSGPFLPDIPGFQVPPDSVFPLQLLGYGASPPSSFRQLLGGFSVSPVLLTCPNHSNRLLLITILCMPLQR